MSATVADVADVATPRLLTRWALCLLAFTVPLEKTVQIPGLGTVALATGLLAGGLAGLSMVRSSGPVRPWLDAHRLMIAFSSWVLLSLLWTEQPDSTLERALTQAQLLIMVLLIWEFVDSRRAVRQVLVAYVLGTLTTALLVLANNLASGPGYRFTAPGTHPNDTAFLLALALPGLWYLGLRSYEHSSRWRWLWWLLIPLLLFVMVLTASRSALMIAIVALAIVPWTIGGWSVSGRSSAALVLILIGGVGVMVLPDVLPARQVERLATIDDEVLDGDLNNRTDLWAIAYRTMGEDPVLGVGAGASRQVVESVRGSEDGVHNTFLSIAADLGVVGLALFLLLLLAVLSLLWPLRGPDRAFTVVLAMTLMVGLVPRHWEYRKATWLVLAILIQFGVSHWADSDPADSGARVAPAPPAELTTDAVE